MRTFMFRAEGGDGLLFETRRLGRSPFSPQEASHSRGVHVHAAMQAPYKVEAAARNERVRPDVAI